MTTVKISASRGRPRAYDRETVLGQAMRVFWASGYEGTSIPMLTEAMGISAQSLYAAFTSKDALYREAIEFYSNTIEGFAARALEAENDAIDAVIRLLRDAAKIFAQTAATPGCMITTAPADVAENPLTLLGRRLRADSIERIAARLKRGIAERQVPEDLNCKDWAHYIGSVVQGMSVQARDGVMATELFAIADIAAQSLNSNRGSVRRRETGALPQ